MAIVKLVLVLVAAYVTLVVVLWAVQDRLLFPSQMAATTGTPLPGDAPRLTLTTTDGTDIHGVRLTPPATPVMNRVIILGFGGNAWNAEDAASYLYTMYPDAEVVVFHYRGYGPSKGRASVDALIADAPLIYDKVREGSPDARIVAVGFSIGSGVAIHLARERPLDGLLLVTPFDSLAALAAHHFPWVPAAKLIHNPMRNADLLRGLAVPSAVIAAELDEVIPQERTSEIRGATKKMVYSRTIKGANHNDIYRREEFATAMREALAAIRQTWP